MLDFLRQEGISEELIARIEDYRKEYPAADAAGTALIIQLSMRYFENTDRKHPDVFIPRCQQ